MPENADIDAYRIAEDAQNPGAVRRLNPRDFPELGAGAEGARLMPILQIINRMLEPQIDRRYRSAIEIQTDIHHQLGGLLEDVPIRTSGDSVSAAVASGPESVPSVVSPIARQMRELEARWESSIGFKSWDAAQQFADEMLTLRPDGPEGHLYLAETKLRQAESLESAGGNPKVVTSLFNKSVRVLTDGLKVVAPAEQLQLRQRLAHVYRVLKDEQMAEFVLRGER